MAHPTEPLMGRDQLIHSRRRNARKTLYFDRRRSTAIAAPNPPCLHMPTTFRSPESWSVLYQSVSVGSASGSLEPNEMSHPATNSEVRIVSESHQNEHSCEECEELISFSIQQLASEQFFAACAKNAKNAKNFACRRSGPIFRLQ